MLKSALCGTVLRMKSRFSWLNWLRCSISFFLLRPAIQVYLKCTFIQGQPNEGAEPSGLGYFWIWDFLKLLTILLSWYRFYGFVLFNLYPFVYLRCISINQSINHVSRALTLSHKTRYVSAGFAHAYRAWLALCLPSGHLIHDGYFEASATLWKNEVLLSQSAETNGEKST